MACIKLMKLHVFATCNNKKHEMDEQLKNQTVAELKSLL